MWKGKPLLIPYMLSIYPVVLFGIIIYYFIYLIITDAVYLILLPFSILATWFIIGAPIVKYLLFKNLEYIITDEDIIIRSGIFRKKNISIRYNEIYDIFIVEHFFEKITREKTGTIFIHVYLVGKTFSEFGGNFRLLSGVYSQPAQGYFMLRSIKGVGDVKDILDNILRSNNINKVNSQAELSARLKKEYKV